MSAFEGRARSHSRSHSRARTRTQTRVACSTCFLTLAVALFANPVAAQPGPRSGLESIPRYAWYLEGLSAALVTLVVCGLFIALAPRYTRRVTDLALERPGSAFLIGLVVSIAIIVVAVFLAITVIGMIIAIPMLLVFGVVAFLTAELAFLAMGRLASDDWTVALLVAVGIAWFVGAIPVFGSLLGFVLACLGFGAFVLDVS